ncbi:DUF6301 family protein [Actinoallomurus iriomotensis]|uniref:TY-Chap N-terminal domain-containing protein n=1 Tax=Actinoallomurus iriomotensis TaxID=478107 RepID=A0A9W6S4D0_9ACTN|nr:DUF6301 family protein [Actinoallomurus iriomotensis]GLY86938.1 hypothetical protein Airi02_048670 [Actinoallomurus iriomotensis]
MAEWLGLGRSDIERFLRVADGLGWDWDRSALPEVATDLGCRMTTGPDDSYSAAEYHAGDFTASVLFHVDKEQGRVLQITIHVTDIVGRGEGQAFLLDTFAGTVAAGRAVFGDPDRSKSGALATVRWDRPGGVAKLYRLPRSVQLDWTRPDYAKWEDEMDAQALEDHPMDADEMETARNEGRPRWRPAESDSEWETLRNTLVDAMVWLQAGDAVGLEGPGPWSAFVNQAPTELIVEANCNDFLRGEDRLTEEMSLALARIGFQPSDPPMHPLLWRDFEWPLSSAGYRTAADMIIEGFRIVYPEITVADLSWNFLTGGRLSEMAPIVDAR